MLGNEGSNRSYTMIGVKEGHHSLSHHREKADLIAQIRKIDHYLVGQYATFVKKLRAIKEGEGTLLDNCMVVYGSGLGDGNAHNHDNLPILLAGRGGGTLEAGRHIKFAKQEPLNNLFLSMLDRMGASVERFGDSTGRLKGI
jgi:hypothetical protein